MAMTVAMALALPDRHPEMQLLLPPDIKKSRSLLPIKIIPVLTTTRHCKHQAVRAHTEEREGANKSRIPPQADQVIVSFLEFSHSILYCIKVITNLMSGHPRCQHRDVLNGYINKSQGLGAGLPPLRWNNHGCVSSY